MSARSSRLGENFKFNQDIFGVKVRVLGDAVLDQDTCVDSADCRGHPVKHNEQGDIVRAVGAVSNSGTDFYLCATKLLLAQSLLLNGMLRFTKANQFGLLGFGGDKSNGYKPEFESSVALSVIEERRGRRRISHEAEQPRLRASRTPTTRSSHGRRTSMCR